jgi:hypothetical protein
VVDERDQLFHRLEAEVAKTKKLEEELVDVMNLLSRHLEADVTKTKKLREELKDAKNLNEGLNIRLNEMGIAKMDKDNQDGNNIRPPTKKRNQERSCALEAETLAETTSQITKEEPKKQRLEQVS